MVSFANQTLKLLLVTALCGAILAGAAFLLLRSSCATDTKAVTGMERIEDGKHLYFDGRCWTDVVMPPRDTPF
jgi:Flp pilus assembly protein protease CpaA